MKVQHVAILFIVIFIPIILVTSYYISLQVDTIRLEESYDTKLLDATYDAMSAFELNTANEDLSTVSDSLRSIIEASNNIFFNTLVTNFGVSNASKSYVQPYIPAILYTLYDGYYIYAPTNAPEVCVDKFGQTISVGDLGVGVGGTIPGTTIKYYTFDKNSITYSTITPTEPESSTVAKVTYDQAGEDYGQMLYKNQNGTYSTKLHNEGGEYATQYKKSYILKSYVPYSARYVKR